MKLEPITKATMKDLIKAYNYDEFVPEKFEQWLNFEDSFPLGKSVPDFPLWRLDEFQTGLLEEISKHKYTFVEFGSFT